MTRMSWPTTKALLVSVFFAVIGVYGFMTTTLFDNALALPLGLYYATITINTFFSIQIFSAITPKDFWQIIFDATLVLSYCALAFSFGSVLTFSFISGILFLVAIGKYVHLNRLISFPAFLRRKIFIEKLGALLSFSTFIVAAFGFVALAAWILGGVFAIANVYFLVFRPMYRLDERAPLQ